MNHLKTLTILCTSLLVVAGCDIQQSGEQGVSSKNQAEKSTELAESSCNSCGSVISITPVTVDGEGSGAGLVIGAVVGGLLGNQVGGGSGKDAATVIGVVGGAVAGNEIEKKSKSQTYYEVAVRLNNGDIRTVNLADTSQVSIGTNVKVVGNNIELL